QQRGQAELGGCARTLARGRGEGRGLRSASQLGLAPRAHGLPSRALAWGGAARLCGPASSSSPASPCVPASSCAPASPCALASLCAPASVCTPASPCTLASSSDVPASGGGTRGVYDPRLSTITVGM